MEHDYVVILPTETHEDEVTAPKVISVIWRELSGGVGPWGALGAIVAVILSLVPFPFSGGDTSIGNIGNLLDGL